MWLYCLALAVAAVIALPTADRPRPSPSPTFEFRNGTPHTPQSAPFLHCFAHDSKSEEATSGLQLNLLTGHAPRADKKSSI